MSKYSLVILAAGMGSRYGGTKQLDNVSEYGETIMDFSLFDAVKAGFDKVVFIVRKDILEEVKADFGEKLKGKVAVEYVCQETTDVPEIYKNNQRTKPWGTGHALLSARNVIKENFCVINADDFYGYDAFQSIISHLKNIDQKSNQYAMVGYLIQNTVSDNGSVSRGESFVDKDGKLSKIIERTAITKQGEKISYQNKNGDEVIMPHNTVVSMNFLGFSPTFIPHLEQEFNLFLEKNSEELKTEFFLPSVVDTLIQENKATVSVLTTNSEWMGVTYREDKDIVIDKIRKLKKTGLYPEILWE